MNATTRWLRLSLEKISSILFLPFLRNSTRHSMFQQFLILSFSDFATLIYFSRAFIVSIEDFCFSTLTLTTSSSSFCSRRFESFKRLERRSVAAMTSGRRSVIGKGVRRGSASRTDALRRGDRGVPCWDDAKGGECKGEEFCEGRSCNTDAYPGSPLLPQLEEKGKLVTMFFQTGGNRLDILKNVLCVALRATDVALFFYFW